MVDRSSIYPLLISILIIETPAVALTYDIINKQFYSFALVPTIIILQVASIILLLFCVYTDPGILPQHVDRYEWKEDFMNIPAVNHMNLSDHKYLFVSNGLSYYQKYCV